MSKSDRVAYFEKYIEQLKKEEEERKQQALNAQNFGSALGTNTFSGGNKGKWYFYNPQSLGFGKASFEKIWGNRKLEDDWRWSDKSTADTNTDTVVQNDSIQKEDERFKLETYLSKIPKKKTEIDSLVFYRNDALYQVGLIYKEQFKNPSLSTQNFERLLKLNKDEKLILPINYHLYQIYTEIENEAKANIHKNLILNQYPESVFAQIITSPDKKIEETTQISKLEERYKNLYYGFKDEQYEKVVEVINKLLPTIQNSDLIPKFELLKALAIGKYQDTNEYKKALEFVAYSYANTEQGKKAKEIINQIQ